MKKLLLFLTVTISLAAQVDAARFAPSIINGSRLKTSDLPAMVLLQSDSSACSGTLVGPKVIFTAAHCINGASEQIVVFSDGTTRTVTLTAHPEYSDADTALNIPYDFAVKNDLAIGVLSEAVNHIAPASVTRKAPRLEDIVLFAGQGLPTQERMFGVAKVVTLSSIGATVRGTGENPQIGASGDSGGPTFILTANRRLALFAVTSTSTREIDASEQLDWPEAIPYTQGVSRLLPPNKNGETGFVENFVRENTLDVCGLNLECELLSAPGL